MNDIDPLMLRKMDLNSLVVLHTLLVTRSVSASADKLCLGQPAVSHILKRLREQTGDPLLCRYGRRMELTPLAERLVEPLTRWLSAGQQILQPRAFDPASIEARVVLSMPDLLEAALLPAIVSALRQRAPGIRLEVAVVPVGEVDAALEQRVIQGAIGYFPVAGSKMARTHLFDSRLVCLYHRDRLMLPDVIGAGDLARHPHVHPAHAGPSASLVEQYLQARGLARQVLVTTASLLAIPALLAQLPALSVLPEVIGRIVRQGDPGLGFSQLAEEGLSVRVDYLWHPRLGNDPLQCFLGDLIREAAAQLAQA